MAGRISQSFIDELMARADIVELIGSRVPLKRAGHEYKACCPFHEERTASFWVSPSKQFYHCFGCGAHGTALGFLMQFDRLSFPEAVEELAVRLGLTVLYDADPRGTSAAGTSPAGGSPTTPGSDPDASLNELYELLGQVAEYYRTALARHAGARSYAARRGLSPEILERFGIGYATDSWNSLLQQFAGRESALLAAGLIIERDAGGDAPAAGRGTRSGYYDRFRDRLMFPIRDTRGRVIGFGGRVLGAGEPKYLNSPETAAFHKGKELYGLLETRLARRPLRRLLIVEGYMDVVRLHQHDLTYAVATLGTSTTPEHLRRAFRWVSELVFCFDGDRAGRAAAWRALQTALPEARAGREMRFLFLPEGEDPDSLVGRQGGEHFEALLATALPLSEYLVAHLAEEADITHADGKARFIALARPLLEKVAPGIYRELLVERLASALQLPVERLEQWLARPASDTTPANSATSATHATAFETRQSRPAHRRRGAPGTATGRGGLVTQAIALLLHFPGCAVAVTREQSQQLGQSSQPGAGVLAELLVQQASLPTTTLAQTLERWRERGEYARFCQLAAAVPLAPDAAAAAQELANAVQRLLERERDRLLESLIEKARLEPLDAAEKAELQRLTGDQAAAVPPARAASSGS